MRRGRLRQQLLQPGVLLCQRPKPRGLGHIKPAKLRPPRVEGRTADAVPAAHTRRRGIGLVDPLRGSTLHFSIWMVCSSLNLLRFMRSPLAGADSTGNGHQFRGARHTGLGQTLSRTQLTHVSAAHQCISGSETNYHYRVDRS